MSAKLSLSIDLASAKALHRIEVKFSEACRQLNHWIDPLVLGNLTRQVIYLESALQSLTEFEQQQDLSRALKVRYRVGSDWVDTGDLHRAALGYLDGNTDVTTQEVIGVAIERFGLDETQALALAIVHRLDPYAWEQANYQSQVMLSRFRLRPTSDQTVDLRLHTRLAPSVHQKMFRMSDDLDTQLNPDQ